MRGSWMTVALIDCLAILSYLTFIKTTTIMTKGSFRRSLEYKQSILPKAHVENNLIELSRSLGGKHLREKHRLPQSSFYNKKGKMRAFKKRFRKQSDEVLGQNKPDVSKRDYFFAPGSPYERMTGSVDRRMFLVHRGERGPCFFHACHHGGMCIPRRHGFYCECLPGFIGTRCEVKKECRPETCKNGGTCTEIAVGRHLCTCPVGFLGDDCEARSPCHPNPCRNEGTCSQTDESYTCVCEQGFRGKNCGIANKCSPNPCKNGGVCFEENNDYVCNCPQGFKGKTCEVISECSSVYCLNGGTCRDEPSGYKCDCRFGFYGKRCEASACHPNPCQNDGACLRFGNQYSCQCKQGFSGNRCKVQRPCSLGLCLNGGTCVDGSFTNSKYGFACVCLRGFDGIMCEKHLPDDLGDTL